MLSRMWFILPYASEDSQVSHCTVTELTALAAHSLFHASRRVAASPERREKATKVKNETITIVSSIVAIFFAV